MNKDQPQLIKALGIQALSQEEQEEILKRVDARLQKVVVDTVLENLSNEDSREFRDMIMKGENLEDGVARISVRIPSLAEKLESAVSLEIARFNKILAA